MSPHEKEASEGEPRDPDALLREGERHFEAGRIDEAIPLLQRAKAGAPRVAGRAGYLLGQCLIRKRIYKLALRELEAAREAIAAADRPLWRETTYLLGRIHEAGGRKDLALAEYERIAAEGREDEEGEEGPGLGGVGAPLRPGDPPRRPPPTREAQATASGEPEAG